jgi:hypothetical protein
LIIGPRLRELPGGAAGTSPLVNKTTVFSTELLVENMPRIGGFHSFNTARRAIQGFEAMLWLRKGFGFAGTWTVREQNRLLGVCFGLQAVNKV